MNVLIFVISLVMILTLMTYGRLDMYKNFVVTQGEFEKYMVKEERNSINSAAKKWYDWTHIANKESKSRPAPSNATPYVSVYGFFHPEARPSNYEVQKELLKRLITIVFGQQKDYQEFLQKNPNLLEELIQAIEAAGTKLTQQKIPLKKTADLEELDLENQPLQDVYYWMIKGYKTNLTKENNLQNTVQSIDNPEAEAEEPSENQSEDYFHEEGNISLLDFITLNNKQTIRVYLAPPQVLLAIFGDPHTVEDIMKTRVELYHQLKKDADSKDLGEQFKQKFASRAVNIPSNMLDFTVSGTNPQDYDKK